jgi:DNA-binding NtrC family response regulator
MPVRVLIADDVEVIRSVIRDLLAREPTIEVCGEAANFSQTFDLATSLKPDVILLDLHMPDGDRPKSDFVKVDFSRHDHVSWLCHFGTKTKKRKSLRGVTGQWSFLTRENSSMN